MAGAIIGALIIGLSLGVFGSGGSILTVPVLMYIIGMPANVAIASSLLIVAGISLISSVIPAVNGKVSWPHVLLFGLPGIVGTYLGAWLGVSVDSRIQLTVFVLLMLLASYFMWRSKAPTESTSQTALNYPKIMLDGTLVGVVTGFVGVGGGFLIVPALVLLGGVPIVMAIGTSLSIIALKSFAGFYKYYEVLSAQQISFDWSVIAIMVLGGVAGSFVGLWLGSKINKQKLSKAFAVFLVCMGVFVLGKSVLLAG